MQTRPLTKVIGLHHNFVRKLLTSRERIRRTNRWSCQKKINRSCIESCIIFFFFFSIYEQKSDSMHQTCKIKSRHRTRNPEVDQNRIKKLLASEYSDFSDVILVESPFAETTRNGRGIRQVSLALTPSKLIVAADVFNEKSQFFCPRTLDPSIESFELISVYPLRCVNLSIFSRRRRKTLKAR